MDKNSLSPMIIKRNMFGEGGTQLVRKGGTEGRGGEGRESRHSECYRSAILSISLSPRLYVQWRFRAGVEKQFMALQKGFHELIPPHLLKMFDEKELELLISGLGKVDVEDWKANSRLKHCTPETSVIQWFWEVRGGGRKRERGGRT